MNDKQDALFKEMLSKSKVIAVVGISNKAERSSYGVAEYLTRHYEIIPVNPMIEEWQGRKAYPSLEAIPEDIKIDMANVFRRSELVDEVIDQVIERKIPYVWMQLGVINQDAAERAEASGSKAVMDSCIAVVHNLLNKQEKLQS